MSRSPDFVLARFLIASSLAALPVLAAASPAAAPDGGCAFPDLCTQPPEAEWLLDAGGLSLLQASSVLRHSSKLRPAAAEDKLPAQLLAHGPSVRAVDAERKGDAASWSDRDNELQQMKEKEDAILEQLQVLKNEVKSKASIKQLEEHADELKQLQEGRLHSAVLKKDVIGFFEGMLQESPEGPSAIGLLQGPTGAPIAAAPPPIPVRARPVPAPLWACCALPVAAVLAVACAWARWGEILQPGKPSERSHLLDNSRILTQFLVVYGHFLWIQAHVPDTVPADSKTWLSGATGIMWSMQEAATHLAMPSACFVSGVCSQGVASRRRVRSFVQFLVVPTIIWTCGVGVLTRQLFTRPFDGFPDAVKSGFPGLFGFEWYLQGLIFWRSAAFLFFNDVQPLVLMVGSLVVSCLGGYVKGWGMYFGDGDVMLTTIQVNCTTGFLPFFVLGYVFPFQAVLKAMPQPRWPWRALAALLVALWLLVICPLLETGADPHFSYETTQKDVFGFTLNSPLEYGLYWTRRLSRFVLDATPMLLTMLVVVPRCQTPLTHFGAHTLYPYICHHISLTWRDKLVAASLAAGVPPPVVTSTWGHVLVLALHVPICLSMTLFFCTSWWRRLFDWCWKPKWMDPGFDFCCAPGDGKPPAATSGAPGPDDPAAARPLTVGRA